MFCSVVILSPPYALLTYALPQDLPLCLWMVGGRVVVPLGQSWRVGILTDFMDSCAGDFEAKTLCWPVDHKPLFTKAYLDFIANLSAHQMDSPGRILGRVLPQGIRELPIFTTCSGQVLTLPELASPDQRQKYVDVWLAGEMSTVRRARAQDRFFSLAIEPPWSLRGNAILQQAVLKHLDQHGTSSMAMLRKGLGTGVRSALQALMDKGLVQEVESRIAIPVSEVPVSPLQLSAEQSGAVDQFTALLDSGQAHTGLLFGITSSGKTAVYLELARRCLALGRHVFLLAPEVAIALKLHEDAHTGLQNTAIYLYHGYLSPTQRQRIFMDLAQADKPCVVVGTRSSLFLPVEPGLIILDEEHDASFKQDEGLIYQAKDVAYGRIVASQGLMLMGSATPDVKVFHGTQKGAIHLASLEQRVGGGEIPEISLVDLRVHPQEYGPFATSVGQAVVQAVGAGEQVIILHNRRGYAPVLYCQACAEPIKCPHCQISLTLHKGRGILLCHYCGFTIPFSGPCPTCQTQTLVPLGSGTERLEEFLSSELPQGTGVLRLDRDIARRAGAMQEVLDSFARGQVQVLVGTQMLSKGHHFPGVTLVVVVDGDLGLNLPDYRATERCFQLLVQVAGRAGRGDKPGRVLIQTRNPGHYCWQYIQNNDYTGFFTQEIALRQVMHYPPFVKLGLIRLSWPVHVDYEQSLAEIGAKICALAKELGVQVLGPAPAPLSILRGRRRFQCLLKAGTWPAIRALGVAMKKNLHNKQPVRMSVDLDPVDML